VAVNCAAIPETLQESELFGHEKGAFTGATDRRVGRFEQANGGTLLFDEVGELSAALQAKLLRVLQERRFSRVGSGGEIEVDVRVLCATHRNLADEVSAGRFREDLFYRLAVVELDVPALREREGDIPLLAQAFLDAYDQSRGETGQNRSLDIPVLQTFLSYPWPGNVRELQNAVQRAAVLSQGSVLKLEDLPKRLREFAAAHGPQDGWPGSEQPVGDFSGARTDADVELTRSAERPRSAPHPTGEQAPPGAGSWDRAPAAQPPRDPVLRPFLPAGMTLEEIEELAVREAFRRARGNVSATARELDISRSVLYRKLDRFQIRDADG
jgi:DNA-binding NtrC family response regulator